MGICKRGMGDSHCNNNPETVSTDFDIADKLYFEPLTTEDVEAIVKIRETGRSSCTVRWTDSDQVNREPDEDGCKDPRNKSRGRRRRRGP